MNRKIRNLMILFLALLGSMASHAVYGDILYQRVDTRALSVYSLYKDHTGLLWVGTSKGLMTYPQLLSSMPTAYKRPHELSIIISQIREDNLGRLWLRSQANHALIYDPRTNALISDVEKYLQGFGLKLWYEFLMETDDKGRVWFYKDNKLTVYDFKNNRRAFYTFPATSGRVIDVAYCQGRMYVATARHLFTATLRHGRIICRYLSTFPEPLNYDPTMHFAVDGRQNIWLKGNGKLMRYDVALRQWKTYGDVAPDIMGIEKDAAGKIVVATSNHGLYVFDAFGNFCQQIIQTAPLVDGLSNNHIQALYADPQSRALLIGYHKNNFTLLRFGDNQSRLIHIQDARNHYIPEDVISLYPTRTGSFWAGTEDNGAYELDAQGNILRNLFPGTTATAVMEDHSGKVWAGLYYQGLYCEDGRHFFPGQSPYNIIEVSPTRFFVNLNGGGLFVLNPETGQARQIATDNVWIMDIRRFGGKIFGATPLYLYIIDERTLQVEKIPASRFGPDFGNGIKTMMIDRRGWVWMVNYMLDSPVMIYDYPHHRVINAKALSSFTLSALAEDKAGNVWCSTDEGLVRVTVSHPTAAAPTFKINNFGSRQNITPNERAAVATADGRLLMGTTGGVFQFYPHDIVSGFQLKNGPVSPLSLAALRVNDIDVSPGDTIGGRIPVKCDLSGLRDLRLGASENNLTLEFCPRDIMDEQHEVWVYRLEGQTNYFMRMNGHTVTLSNLSSGTYHLILAREVDGKVQGHQYQVLTIHIAPPFYASPWAIFVYIIFIVTIGYIVHKLVYNRQQYKLRTQQLRMEAEQEEQLNEMKLDFFTNVSHEFRTPLTMILTPLDELLKDHAVDGKLRETLELIDRNARRLFNLINQLLDFRRLQTTRPELHAQPGDLGEFVTKICRLYDLQARLHHITFDYGHDHFDRLVPFDALKMEKVVNNLLSNAFKYTPDGGTIRVTVTEEDGAVHLRVADTGQGIADADKVRVFDRYYRGANHLDDSHSSGVGLHLVKEYVELHKGTVTITDNEPRGTVFDVMLPLPTAAAPEALPREEEASGSVQHDHSLLIVEDNMDMLTYLSQQLSRDYRIFRATDGNGALEILKDETPDVIISDVMMAGMDGLTLCKAVKGDINLSHIPVILLTAKALDEDELKGLQMGANDYVTKPFNLDVLRERIRLQIERREAVHDQIVHHVELEPSEVAVTTLDEQFIKDAIAIVEKNMDNVDFTVDDLSNELGMHRTNVYKKMQFITGKTPLQFIRMLRLKRAHQLMSQGGVMVSQIAYQVGFNNPKLFSRYFKEEYGVYPSEFIKQRS